MLRHRYVSVFFNSFTQITKITNKTLELDLQLFSHCIGVDKKTALLLLPQSNDSYTEKKRRCLIF